MIRVHFELIPSFEDVDANQSIVGSAGELILNQCELGEVIDRDSMRKSTTIVSSQWIRTYSATSRWLYAEPTPEEAASGQPAELEETPWPLTTKAT